MSELTKIAAILFKNLSDALLTTASELRKLENPDPLSQASPKIESIMPTRPKPIIRESYPQKEKILVMFDGQNYPLKCVILKRLSDAEYLVYQRGGLKSDAKKVTYDQILGIDPDR